MLSRRVSVVIVNYNSGSWLVRCVRSVLASPLAVEIYVGDNRSSDDSMARLAAECAANANVYLRYNPANLGFAKAVNRLLREVLPESDWILLLNPDCEIAPDTLPEMLMAIDGDARIGMAGCLIVNPDGSEQRGCRRRIPTLKSAALNSLGLARADFDLAGTPLPAATQPVEAISGAFMLLRKEALNAVGLLDEGYFMHCEDLDWCLRFTQASWRIVFVPSVRILHAKGVGTATRPLQTEWWKHRGMLRFWRKFYGRGPRIVLVLALAPAVIARYFISIIRIGLRRKLE